MLFKRLNTTSRFICFSLLVCLGALPVYALAPDLEEKLGGFTSQSFRLYEKLSVSLDGSEASSSITKNSVTENQLTYMGPDAWRVRRQVPFSHAEREILRKDGAYFSVIPPNRFQVWPEPVNDTMWAEMVLSPLRLAEQWSLSEADSDFSSWLGKAKKAKGQLQNAEGDTITVEATDDRIKISANGKILHDDKTRVAVQLVWELTSLGKLDPKSLDEPFKRSF